MNAEGERTEHLQSKETRRKFLATLLGCVAFSGSGSAQTDDTARNSTTGARFDISFRSDWVKGTTQGTRVTAGGELVLDDVVEFSDNFDWEDPSESPFEWNVRSPKGTRVTPHPDAGYVSLHTSDRAGVEILELEQNNGFYYDMDEHQDWRLNVTESNVKSSVKAAWEFWFSRPPLGTDPWVLIDAGGSDDLLEQKRDDACGMGFFTRKDQLLTHYSDSSVDLSKFWKKPGRYLVSYLTKRGYWSGGRYFATSNQCWDRFQNAPIDHRRPTELSLELLGSDGVINAYVNDSLQADLTEAHNQHILHDDRLTTGIRLHDRDENPETGYLHHCSVQRVGKKQSSGTYQRVIRTKDPVDWQGYSVDATVPQGTDYSVSFAMPRSDGRTETAEQVAALPPTETLVFEISMETVSEDVSPRISAISLTDQNSQP